MTETVRQGALLLADIGGYTAYVTRVELEHAHDILADLLGVVVDGLCPPLQLAKLEGDAVFCVTPEAATFDGRELLSTIESTYLAFARRRRTVEFSSSCTCDACRRTSELELKFCVHHGSFIEHRVAGSSELVGSDVILAHRLLKNHVASRGYALVTDAFTDAAEIPGLTPHVERYEDVGEIRCGLVDLEALWQGDQETTRNVVARDDCTLLFEADIAVPQQQVWEALTDPAKGMRWKVAVDDIRESNPSSGRGVGTVTHCVHGRTTIEQEIVDWLPPHHLTFREHNPAGPCLWTFTLAPVDGDERTHLEWRFALSGGRRQAIMWRAISWRVRRILQSNFEALLDYALADYAENSGEGVRGTANWPGAA